MASDTTFTPARPDVGSLAGVSLSNLARTGEVEIAGQRYITIERLAETLNVTPRTVARWHAARRGPPRTKVGRLVLIPVSKLPGWLESHGSSEPVRAQSRRGRLAP